MSELTTVTGPVTGGSRGRPFLAPAADVSPRGYVVEEFFLEGEATSYRPAGGAQLGMDGRWPAVRDDAAAFRTRILVVRPAGAEQFNGTVVVQWLNVTAGYELGTSDDDELLSGYAWVGVSAQKIGIEGFPPEAPRYGGRQAPTDPLKRWDAERYASLEHPGDRYSYDIFTQAARAVGPDRDRSVDPMGGLEVARLVASGASQSGARLTTYINAVQPLEGVFDGFMPSITSGWGIPLEEAPAPAAGGIPVRPPTRIRDDGPEPVLVVNSECEAVGMYPARRPDADNFRFWEVAGAPHVVAVAPPVEPRPDGRIDNPLTYRPVLSAAYGHMHRWLADGTPPPLLSRIEFTMMSRPPSGATPRAMRSAASGCPSCKRRWPSTTGATSTRRA